MSENVTDVFLHLHPYQWGILSGVAILFLIRMVYVLFFFGRVAFSKKPRLSGSVPVSLLMPYHNEEENLRNNLPKLLGFENVEYEVVAVDEFSGDDSLIVLNAFKNKFSNLQVSRITQYLRHAGKVSRNLALKAARNEWVMVLPPSANSFLPGWLFGYSSGLNSEIDIAVGYSGLKANGTFRNVLFRTESFFQQITSFAYILNGLPYVATETNVAFKKGKYFERGGYGDKINEHALNLELLINNFIQKKKTALFISGEQAVQLEKDISWRDLFELMVKETKVQKHLSNNIRVFQMVFDLASLLFLPALIFSAITIPALWPLFLAVFLVYAGTGSVIIKKILYRLQERKIFLPSLTVVLLRPYFRLIFGVLRRITG